MNLPENSFLGNHCCIKPVGKCLCDCIEFQNCLQSEDEKHYLDVNYLWFGSYTGTWIDELFREEQIFTKIKFMPLRVNMGGKMVWLVVAKMVPNKPSLVAASLEKQTKNGQTLIIGKWEISSVDYSMLWFGYPS